MPLAPKSACTSSGCRRIASVGPKCAEHAIAERQQIEQQRGNRHERGYTNEWASYSKARLQLHPHCVGYPFGVHNGRPVEATVTDHIIPHRGDFELFWEGDNHQSLCRHCHAEKTAIEDGRWGRKKDKTTFASALNE